MKKVLLLVVICFVFIPDGKAQRSVYLKAVDDYYNFQYTSAIAGFQKTIADNKAIDQKQLIKSYYYLSMSCFELDKVEEALDYLFEGSGLAIEKYGEESSESADFYTGYGKLYHYNGSYDTAKLFYQSALELKEKSNEPEVIGEIYANLGYACDYKGEFDSALIYYKEAATYLEKSLGIYHTYTDWVYASMPYVASNAGNYVAEVDAAKKSLEIKVKLWGEGTEDHWLGMQALMIAYEHSGDGAKQKEWAEKLLPLTAKLYGDKSEEYALKLSQLGNAYAAINRTDEAKSFNIKGYELMKKLKGEKSPATLNLLRNIGNVLYDGGRYLDAKTYYNDHLSKQLKLNGKSSPELIQPYEDMAQVHENLGEFEVAMDYYLKAKELKKGDLLNLLPKSLISIARIEDAQGKDAQALESLDDAILANLKYNNGDLATEAFIENNIGTIYNQLGKYEKALEYLNESLEARLELFGEQSKEVAQTLTNIANVYQNQGLFKQALSLHLQVMSAEEEMYGMYHPEVALTLVNLGNAYAQNGQYREEIAALKRAERIQRKANGEKHEGLVSVYHNLATAYVNLVDYRSALEYSQKHKELVNLLFGNVSEQMGDNLNTLGMIKHGMGYTSEAFSLYKDALRIFQTMEPQNAIDLATVYNNLGVSYLDFQEYTQAEEYLTESIRQYLEVFDENHPQVITTKMNLGLVEYGKSNYPKAIDIFNSTLGTGLNVEMNDSLLVATIYQNRALAELMNDEMEASLHSTNKALEIRERILGVSNPLVTELLINSGNLYLKQDQTEKAISYFEKASRQLTKEETARNSLALIKLYLSLAAAETMRGDLDQAEKYVQLSIETNIRDESVENSVLYFIGQVQLVDLAYLQFLETGEPRSLDKASQMLKLADRELIKAEQDILNDTDRLEFGVWKSLMTNVGIKNALAKYQLSGNPEDKEEAFYYAERSKSNVLISALKESKVNNMAGVDAQLLLRDRELKLAIQRIKEELFKGEAKMEQDQVKVLSDQLFDLKREQEDVLAQLRSNKKYLKLHEHLEIATVQDIQKGLRENQAIVEFAASDSTLHIFVITRDSYEVFSKKYEERFDQMITAIRNAIIFKSNSAVDFVGEKLYQLALSDVEDHFRENDYNVDDLTIIPEGPFNYFPFESLRRNGKYLIEDYDIHYQYSMTLADVVENSADTRQNNSLLAFAPVFSDPSNNTLTSGARDVFTAARSISSEDMRGFSRNGVSISALPGTKLEVDEIDALVEEKGFLSETYLFENAKEEVIKSGVLKDYQYVHFATHGFVNEAVPAYSGVFLSQDEASEEDCILFASEIYNLEIDADLVTLSACETGLGKFSYGEGIVGLTRAFLFAGAKNLLVSQWKVSDASTAKMMVDFYDHILAGKSKATALREAKLTLIKSSEFSEPYYWAPFVLIGE
ncbi:MAG: CHAT domain-containing protein [Cyclobacteriaceae bacterium]